MTNHFFEDDEYLDASNEDVMLLNTKISSLENDIDYLTKNMVSLTVKLERMAKQIDAMQEMLNIEVYRASKVV
jgi:chaperonin cofactor prefoldin